MTSVEIFGLISLIIGSNVATFTVQSIFNRKKHRAEISKTKHESEEIQIGNEVKMATFYKDQLTHVLEKYDFLEKKFDLKIKDHENCESKIATLQLQYHDLQRQFTLFKTQNPNKS